MIHRTTLSRPEPLDLPSAGAIRFAVALVSFAALGLELALMRWLSLRFWHHFAFMAVSVALLGFGASGTLLSLCQPWVRRHFRMVLLGSCVFFAAGVPLVLWSTRITALDVHFLPWNLTGELGNVLLLELALLVPFLFAGSLVGASLMDSSDRIGGHYAANLIGSGLGAFCVVGLMWWLSTGALIFAMGIVGIIAALPLVPWRRPGILVVFAGLALAVIGALWLTPRQMPLSQYKTLSQLAQMPNVDKIYAAYGPLGRIDVVRGPALHFAPGLSLNYQDPVPEHVLMVFDGDQPSPVYDVRQREDWKFLDYTTGALPYHLRPRESAAVVGAGGGSDLGLALYHQSEPIAGLEMNPQVIATMKGPLRDIGGRVYDVQPVHVLNREARGFFSRNLASYSIIQLPASGSFGATGAGLYAAQESYLYTVESMETILDSLNDNGLLCVTAWMRTPPRDGPRMFNLLRAALQAKGLQPSRHLAMIRSWVTVSILASKSPLTDHDTATIRAFCERRSFDVCYLPDIQAAEVNRYHVLDEPQYFRMATALISPEQRQELVSNYLFQLEETTDDKPFFFHFFRWRALPVLRDQLGVQSRAYLETGYLMVIGAVVQIIILSLLLIILPLAGRGRAVGPTGQVLPALLYFLFLGVGFMFLEMSLLQKMILYLAHPVYSAAVVIAGFLVFGGLGSQVSGKWRASVRPAIRFTACSVVITGVIYTFLLDTILAATQGWDLSSRVMMTLLLIAPLAFCMGHLLPLGIGYAGRRMPMIVPWAWAVNGCTSVIATVSVPVLAMQVGFSTVIIAALACYACIVVLTFVRPFSQALER